MKSIASGVNKSGTYSVSQLHNFKDTEHLGHKLTMLSFVANNVPVNGGGINPDTGSNEKQNRYYQGEKAMKLNLLFIVMELFTVLAYPIVFVHGKLRQFSYAKESIPLANLLVTVPVTPGRRPIGNYEHAKEM